MSDYKYFANPFLKQEKEFYKLDAVEEVFTHIPIKDIITASYLFAPDFIQVNEYVFVADLFNRWGKKAHTLTEYIEKVKHLESQFHGDSVKIEQAINSWSIVDFFCTQNANTPLTDKEIQTFCDILVYYWRFRVKELFPDKNIVVESGQEIMGELGLTITVYQKR